MTHIRITISLQSARDTLAFLEDNHSAATYRTTASVQRILRDAIENEEEFAAIAKRRRTVITRAVENYRSELERRVPTGRSLTTDEVHGIYAPSRWDYAERKTFRETYAEPRPGRFVHRDIACYGDPREGDDFRNCDMVGKYAMGVRLFCEKHSKQEAARLALDDAKRQTGEDAYVALQDIIDAGKVAA